MDLEQLPLGHALAVRYKITDPFGLDTSVLRRLGADSFAVATLLNYVVFQGDKEEGKPRISLPARTAAQLVVQAGGAVPRGTDDR